MKRRHFIFYSLLFTGGCTLAKNSINSNSNKLLDSVPKQIKLAVTDEKGLKDLLKGYETFRSTLENVLDIKVEFFPVENMISAAPALQLGQVDIVLAGPSEYVVLNARAKAVPVVAIERPKYYPVMVVLADSGIKSLSQLKGKKIAMFAKGGTAGHIYPIKLLMDAGLDPKSDFQSLFLKEKVLNALAKGDVDACALSFPGFQTQLQQTGLSEKVFSVIATGPNLPSDVFVASSLLASNFVDQMRQLMLKNQDKLIQAMLTSLVNEKKYKDSKLVAAADADYNTIREVYKAIGEGNFIN